MLAYEQKVEFTPIFMTSNRSLERVIASAHPHDRACEHTALLEQTQVMNVIRVLIVWWLGRRVVAATTQVQLLVGTYAREGKLANASLFPI